MIDSKNYSAKFSQNLLVFAVKHGHLEHFKSTHFDKQQTAARPNGKGA